MGYSLTPIMFLKDTFKIIPHTATHAKYIGRPVSVREFANGGQVSISERDDNKEFVVTRWNKCSKDRGSTFMEGPIA